MSSKGTSELDNRGFYRHWRPAALYSQEQDGWDVDNGCGFLSSRIQVQEELLFPGWPRSYRIAHYGPYGVDQRKDRQLR